MTDWDIVSEVYKRDNPRSEANGWIQWKGTDVCIDLTCVCGQSGHVDGEFMYCLECPKCGRKYYAGTNIKLIELTPEEAKQEFHEPYMIKDN